MHRYIASSLHRFIVVLMRLQLVAGGRRIFGSLGLCSDRRRVGCQGATRRSPSQACRPAPPVPPLNAHGTEGSLARAAPLANKAEAPPSPTSVQERLCVRDCPHHT
mgnify:CR=1 FL=1